MNRLSTFLGAFALLLLGACSGSGSPAVPSAADELRAASIETLRGEWSPEQMAGWHSLIRNPGQPGVDYDPSVINVAYLPGATVPALPPAPGLPRAKDFVPAAQRSNPILREDRSYEPLTDAIALRYGLSIRHQLYNEDLRLASFNVPQGRDPQQTIAKLRSEFAAAMEYAWFARYYRPAFAPNDPDYLGSSQNGSGGQWGHHKIRVGTAWDFTRGDNDLWVAVCDTGVRLSHEELTGQVLVPEDQFPGSNLDVANDDNTVGDNNGHGTFIAGLVSAHGNNSRTIAGVAYDCRVMPIKIANAGLASDADIIQGCSLAAALGARVVNLSWGDVHFNPQMGNMVNNITDDGVLFIAAAGNEDTAVPHFPSDFENAFSVGSTNNDDRRSDFSNFSDGVDIAAPGEFLKSCAIGNDSDYDSFGFGTSFSAPIVAAAAGLLWSFAPELTAAEVRALLEDSAMPTLGFSATSPVGRLDVGGAFGLLGSLKVSAPQLDRLVQSGTVAMTPIVTDSATQVQVKLNGAVLQTKTSAPWTFQVDTTSVLFGNATIEFVARDDDEEVSDSFNVIIDNTVGSFPLAENFEGSTLSFAPLDVKNYGIELLENIKAIPNPQWTQEQIQENGPANWSLLTSGAFEGQFGVLTGQYGAFEVDALVSRRIDLDAATPTMVFRHHFNIEDGGSDFDKAWVYVTADNGQTFTPASFSGGGQAFFSGSVPAWIPAEIDLSDFSGQTVHIALVLESDQFGSGEDGGQPAGWWIDDIVVSTDFNTNVPTIGGINIEPFEVFGEVPGKTTINAEIVEPVDVAKVNYILDVAPVGTINFKDTIITVETAPFTGEIPVPELQNQLASLRVQIFDAGGEPGSEYNTPVYLFNLAGDTNADGDVEQVDLDGYSSRVGIALGQGGYLPFFDTDLDGLITEADASGVGYNWGESI